ncbi:MAG: SMP-30/gluconolactonase/LRE family protein [Candidatus Omnitrophota bacterium]
MRLLFLLLFSLFISASAHAFTVGNFETPESVVVDPEDGSYYVSNINGSPTGKDANGYISKISPDGTAVIQRYIGNKPDEAPLHAPKGLAIIGKDIFVTDIDTVKGYDKATGKLSVIVDMTKFEAKFLNDLASDGQGILYVSDMMGNKIFRIDTNKNYEVTVFKAGEQLGNPNGLLVNPKSKNLMIVTWGSGRILEIDRQGRIHVLKRGLKGLDGMDLDGEGNLYVSSHGEGVIHRIAHFGRGKVSTAANGLNTPADISYDRAKDELLIPSFKGNTVSTLSGKK